MGPNGIGGAGPARRREPEVYVVAEQRLILGIQTGATLSTGPPRVA